MGLSSDSRQERKIKCAYRAQLRLKQAFEYIDNEFDVIRPLLAQWKGQAKLPEAPSDLDIHIELDGVDLVPPAAPPKPQP